MEIAALSDYTRNLTAFVPPQGAGAVDQASTQDRRALIQAVRSVNAAEVFGQEHELSFAFDRASQRPVVRIVDRKTRAVVDQIPSEQVLRLSEELKQQDRSS
ncbi:MAG: flagellar protein FlaG [Acidobacteriota bacterium]